MFLLLLTLGNRKILLLPFLSGSYEISFNIGFSLSFIIEIFVGVFKCLDVSIQLFECHDKVLNFKDFA